MKVLVLDEADEMFSKGFKEQASRRVAELNLIGMRSRGLWYQAPPAREAAGSAGVCNLARRGFSRPLSYLLPQLRSGVGADTRLYEEAFPAAGEAG